MNPDDYESMTESSACRSKEVEGVQSFKAGLEQQVCQECGQLRLFLVLEDEAGNRMYHTFDEFTSLAWGYHFLNASDDMLDYRNATGGPLSLN